MPAAASDIFDFLRSLPTGLSAALAFVFVVFFLVLIKLQLDAMVKHLGKSNSRGAGNTNDTLQALYETLARIERSLEELTRAVEKMNDESNDSQ